MCRLELLRESCSAFLNQLLMCRLTSYVPIRTPARKLFSASESASYVPIGTPARNLFNASESASYVRLELQRGSCSTLLKLFEALFYVILEENHGLQFDEIVAHDGQ